MNDQSNMAPLAGFHGEKPPAPEWFKRALAHTPERTFVEVEGARLECLAWGKRGAPGLVFLHGGAAHADWWSFIAPFFAATHRVVAPTFSGMGRSDWRERYVFDQFAREARAAAQEAGAFDAGAPLFVGHSFGGRIAMGAARDFGDTLKGAVMVDPPFFAPQNVKPGSPPRTRALRVQPTLGAVVARFRLMPPQPCEYPFILDHIGRTSAREAADAEGKRGWALCFDPHFWEKFKQVDPAPVVAAARCPMALMRGDRSQLFRDTDAAYLVSLLKPGSPHIVIPEAEHHVMIDQPLAFVAALRALFSAWPLQGAYCSLTVTASAAPLPSTTDTCAKPAPSGRQADWRRRSASPIGAPLTNQVNGGEPPSAFRARFCSAAPPLSPRSIRAPSGGYAIFRVCGGGGRHRLWSVHAQMPQGRRQVSAIFAVSTPRGARIGSMSRPSLSNASNRIGAAASRPINPGVGPLSGRPTQTAIVVPLSKPTESASRNP